MTLVEDGFGARWLESDRQPQAVHCRHLHAARELHRRSAIAGQLEVDMVVRRSPREERERARRAEHEACQQATCVARRGNDAVVAEAKDDVMTEGHGKMAAAAEVRTKGWGNKSFAAGLFRGSVRNARSAAIGEA
jgi:hypothetical protein